MAAIVVAAAYTHPVFLGLERPASVPFHTTPLTLVDSTQLRLPWLRHGADEAVRTPQFMRDRAAFALDLLRTGNVTTDRAITIADAAVRQAYAEKVPPALVLGVMLTENDELKPTARSRVGAVGLMQVMPRVWRTQTLRERFGHDLHDDATNVRYGVFILGHFIRKVPDDASAETGWRKALLTYNGCVKGRHTRDCHRYPDVVRREVQRKGRSLCGSLSFEECVARPVWLAMRDSV